MHCISMLPLKSRRAQLHSQMHFNAITEVSEDKDRGRTTRGDLSRALTDGGAASELPQHLAGRCVHRDHRAADSNRMRELLA